MSNSDPFGLGGNIPTVDRSAYDDNPYAPKYKYITWDGKAKENWTAGIFRTNADNFETLPKGWEVKQYRKNPSAAPVDLAVTSLLRVAVIATRGRICITDEDKNKFFYPFGTSKEQMHDGKFGTEQQVLIVPAVAPEEIWILSNKSWYQALSWNNDPTKANAKAGYPPGVEQLAEEYMLGVTKYYREHANYKGDTLPWKCWTWVDLVPLFKEGQPHFVDMGHSTHVNPYTASFKVGQGTGLEHRYVGDELRLYFDAVRANEGLDWVEAWTKGSSQETAEESNGYGYGDVPPSQIKEDDIPF